MSIIPRTSPLNLAYRVAIVTNAFTPLGVVVCKTLLKANALVLGIDHRPRAPSLNAGLGTHFQYIALDLRDPAATVDDALTACRDGFATDRVDMLVLVGDEKDDARDAEHGGRQLRALAEKCIAAIKDNTGTGAVTAIIGQADGAGAEVHVDVGAARRPRHALVSLAADLCSAHADNTRIRFNVVVPWSVSDDVDGGRAASIESSAAYDAAETHMQALIGSERLAKDVPTAQATPKTAAWLYQCANIALWLASDLCADEGTPHRRVYPDGSFVTMDR